MKSHSTLVSLIALLPALGSVSAYPLKAVEYNTTTSAVPSITDSTSTSIDITTTSSSNNSTSPTSTSVFTFSEVLPSEISSQSLTTLPTSNISPNSTEVYGTSFLTLPLPSLSSTLGLNFTPTAIEGPGFTVTATPISLNSTFTSTPISQSSIFTSTPISQNYTISGTPISNFTATAIPGASTSGSSYYGNSTSLISGIPTSTTFPSYNSSIPVSTLTNTKFSNYTASSTLILTQSCSVCETYTVTKTGETTITKTSGVVVVTVTEPCETEYVVVESPVVPSANGTITVTELKPTSTVTQTISTTTITKPCNVCKTSTVIETGSTTSVTVQGSQTVTVTEPCESTYIVIQSPVTSGQVVTLTPGTSTGPTVKTTTIVEYQGGGAHVSTYTVTEKCTVCKTKTLTSTYSTVYTSTPVAPTASPVIVTTAFVTTCPVVESTAQSTGYVSKTIGSVGPAPSASSSLPPVRVIGEEYTPTSSWTNALPTSTPTSALGQTNGASSSITTGGINGSRAIAVAVLAIVVSFFLA